MLERSEQQQLIKSSQDLHACSFQNWHADFAKISIRSKCIRIPEDVVQYLLDEIIILPKECMTPSERQRIHAGYEDEDTQASVQPEFTEFSAQITAAIAELGGSAYPKLNWHSPKDAFWITAGQTMCVKDITDVYQLLKASSMCKEDLVNHSLPTTVDVEHYLVLKKWKDIHPGTEFRCFVRNDSLIAISPRDWPQYHEHILTQKKDIINDILSMFKEQIKSKFPLSDYIFDVVRDTKDRVYLIDFSPFGERWSEPLAFEWEQLLNDFNITDAEHTDDPEFRYLSSDCGIQPSKRNNYGVPRDVVDMFKASSGECNTMEDALFNRLRREHETEDSTNNST